MNTTQIEALLAKFYDGTTNAEEETLLKEYFRGGNYPASLSAEAEQFLFYDTEQAIELPDPDFLMKLEERLTEPPVIRMEPFHNRLFTLTGIAATLLLLIGLFFTIRQEYRKNSEPGLIRDPQLAYTETKKALLLLSASFNTGINQARHFEHFGKGVASVQHFSDFSRYQTIIIYPNTQKQPSKSQ